MKYILTTVTERFNDPVTRVPKERLACGHIRTDRILHENSTAFLIGRAMQKLAPEAQIKARCYKCAKV